MLAALLPRLLADHEGAHCEAHPPLQELLKLVVCLPGEIRFALDDFEPVYGFSPAGSNRAVDGQMRIDEDPKTELRIGAPGSCDSTAKCSKVSL